MSYAILNTAFESDDACSATFARLAYHMQLRNKRVVPGTFVDEGYTNKLRDEFEHLSEVEFWSMWQDALQDFDAMFITSEGVGRATAGAITQRLESGKPVFLLHVPGSRHYGEVSKVTEVHDLEEDELYTSSVVFVPHAVVMR
jgi:hypothetical protein